jgi:hypothetical protein
MAILRSIRLVGALAVFALISVDSVVAQAQPFPAASADSGPTAAGPQIGMPVFSLDGQKIGVVESVGAVEGKVTVINFTMGSVLGFGAKSVAIPMSKFTLKDQYVRVEMTADDVAMLPHQGP